VRILFLLPWSVFCLLLGERKRNGNLSLYFLTYNNARFTGISWVDWRSRGDGKCARWGHGCGQLVSARLVYWGPLGKDSRAAHALCAMSYSTYNRTDRRHGDKENGGRERSAPLQASRVTIISSRGNEIPLVAYFSVRYRGNSYASPVSIPAVLTSRLPHSCSCYVVRVCCTYMLPPKFPS